MKYLFVTAHPDDEALGAGATIQKLVRLGHDVAICILSGKAEARSIQSETLTQDRENSMRILGLEKYYIGDFPNIKMNTVPHLEMVQFIEQAIRDFQPEIMVTHHPADTNDDHRQTSSAAQAAMRMFQRGGDVPSIREFAYMEVFTATEWSLDSSLGRFTPNLFVEVGEEGIACKIKAIQAYQGVMRDYPHPRSEECIYGLAAYRGAQAGCKYAEAFESVFRTY